MYSSYYTKGIINIIVAHKVENYTACKGADRTHLNFKFKTKAFCLVEQINHLYILFRSVVYYYYYHDFSNYFLHTNSFFPLHTLTIMLPNMCVI